MTRRNAASFAILPLALAAILFPVQSVRADASKVGTLECFVDAGGSYIVGSTKDVSCVLYGEDDEALEHYVGELTKYGVDIGFTEESLMVWDVFVATGKTYAPGSLAGNFAGASANASVAFGLSPAVPLSHAEAVSGPLTARSDRGWSLAMDALRLAVRQEDGEGFRYGLGAEATALALAGTPAVLLAKAGLADGPGRVRLDADAVLDRALDRAAAEVPPRITTLSVRSLELDWGRLALRGTGDLRIGADGTPEGTIQLRLANWRDLPPLLVALGLIAAAEAPALTRTMGQLALLSGGKGDLSLPLSFTGGWVALGPLPLGPAPRF